MRDRSFSNNQALLSRRHAIARALHIVNRGLGGGELSFLAGLQLRGIDPHQGLVLGNLITGIDVNLQNAARYFAGQLDVTNRTHLSGGGYGRSQLGPHVELYRSDFSFVFTAGNYTDNNDQRQHDYG